MITPKTFGELFWMTFYPLVTYWKATVVFVSLLALAIWWDRSRGNLKRSPRLLFLALPLVSPLMNLLFGTIFMNQPEMEFLPYVGLFGSLVIAGVTLVLMWPCWWTSLCVVVFVEWPTVVSFIVADMAITNVWY